MKLKTAILLCFLCVAAMSFAQYFQKPSAGKSVVYFTRISSQCRGTNFDFFHDQRYMGSIDDLSYLRIECEPGAHIFWASSENIEFMTAEVVADEIYFVIIDITAGGFQCHVGLRPVRNYEDGYIKKVMKIVRKTDEAVFDEIHCDIVTEEKKEFIEFHLKEYHDRRKFIYHFRHLDPVEAIPQDVLFK